MLNVNRYASVPLQRISQRHLFDIFIIRHPVHNAVFGIERNVPGNVMAMEVEQPVSAAMAGKKPNQRA